MVKKFTAFLLLGLMVLLTACSGQPQDNTKPEANDAAYYENLASEVTIDKVFDAYTVLRDIVQETPLVGSPGASDKADVYLKLESLQTTGSFKLRGAYYAINSLTQEERARGVVTCSAGNHAQGVALAAQKYGAKATIFIPESAPKAKVDATKSYGVDVKIVGKDFNEAKAAAEEFVKQSGGIYIPPYDNPNVIAGQGTIAWEFLKEMPDVEAVVVPVGGGGLLSGISYVVKTLKPSCKVYGVEVEGINSMQLSLEAGKPVAATGNENTLADGIAVNIPSDLTFSVCSNNVDGIVTVTEEQVSDAMLFMLDKHKLVVEGAGAVSVAAVKNNLLPVEGKKTVCIVSGGNLDDKTLAKLIASRAS